MKNWIKLIISVVVCQATGLLGAVFTTSSISSWYTFLNKPFFSPPNWIFGPVWTLLYLSMGVSFYLIWKQGWKKKKAQSARTFFLAQLGFNFIWTPVFFGLRSPFLALFIIIVLWILIVMTIKKFAVLSKTAAYLLVPYLLWVSFALLLNASIVWLN